MKAIGNVFGERKTDLDGLTSAINPLRIFGENVGRQPGADSDRYSEIRTNSLGVYFREFQL